MGGGVWIFSGTTQYNLNRAKSITISAGFDSVIGELNVSLVFSYLAMQKYFAWIMLFMSICCLTVGFEYLYISIPHTIFMNGLLRIRLLEYYVLFL